MSQNTPTIVYTKTDEAPALATYSLLPILKAFLEPAGVDVEIRDISLAARIVSQFSDTLPKAQQVSDDLAELGQLVLLPHANVIKLPNISASVPQLHDAIAELQSQGYDLPDYPENPSTPQEKAIQAKYNVAKGSAVNPVLREGNSDRRAPKAVKAYAKAHPHSMGAWSAESASHVSTMEAGDFRHTERSMTLEKACTVRIDLVGQSGVTTALKGAFEVQAGEVIDAAKMSKKALVRFLDQQVKQAKTQGVLFSLHMKATMMKVSDPIIFGHAVRVFFKDLFEKYAEEFDALGVNPNNGFGDVMAKIKELPEATKVDVLADLDALFAAQPGLAMVDSDRGITNLHVPNDVIIDASMPAMIRTSGRMWNAKGEPQDTKAVIPDSSYAGIYQEVIEFCKAHGAFDPRTMGSVSNVGLMAQKAEEYGSHDKTFELKEAGTVQVVDTLTGQVLLSHQVETGDIWRMCQTKDAPIKDWIKLAVGRAKATGNPALFWLDEQRPHDAELIKKVKPTLAQMPTDGLDIRILAPVEATRVSLERLKAGQDTISVTGNVLRDYLTDLFPILEVGTSAKMLSIVPLMNGGGLFETGAGGSAPKHVQQFVAENHLRWDSLGEFLALGVSLAHLGDHFDLERARILGDTLDEATTKYLMENKSPSRKVGELDNRGSHFYLALYWAQELAQQSQDPELAERFAPVAKELSAHETAIVHELNQAQGSPVDLGGYYNLDEEKAAAAMRPSKTLNTLIQKM